MSAETIQLRWNRPDEADAILEFIAAMGFTPRDRVTWNGLAMSAVVAVRGTEIIGAIPIEPRPVKIAPEQTVQWAHQTCVAIHPELRGGGLGSRLQKLLRSSSPTGTQIMGVYREDPNSQAYKWYLACGFQRAVGIVSYGIDVKPQTRVRDCAETGSYPLDLWSQVRRNGCFVDQRQRTLRAWLEVHPYRSRYRFDIVNVVGGYAVLGVGTLHSPSTRVDLLDFVTADRRAAELLLDACLSRAGEMGATPLRWALAQHDPLVDVARSRGMTPGWVFDLLIQEIEPGLHFDVSSWRYASIDFA